MKSFDTYRFKARLTKAAHKALDEALEVNRLLYNAANEERRYALQLVKSGVGETRLADGVDSWPSLYSQNKELTALRESDMKFANQARRIHIGTLTRLDKAWRSRMAQLQTGAPYARGLPSTIISNTTQFVNTDCWAFSRCRVYQFERF